MTTTSTTDSVTCPCGSGKRFAICHGVGSPLVPPPQLAGGVVTRKLDLACGQNCRAGYEGVDRWPKAQHVVNLFRFPWPFADSSVAELNCSHFIEHIPMIEVDDMGEPVPFGEGIDLFLRFFDECYRILVPGGWMDVATPNARHNRAYQDPTHRRFIVQETFFYVNKEFRDINKLDHYGVRCDFGISVNPCVDQALTLRHPETAARMINHEWNRVLDWQARLLSKKTPATAGK
jgi:predicted SAM-dependent methyltransferase